MTGVATAAGDHADGAGAVVGGLRSAAAAGEGERKQVTVLFADVRGSMGLSGSVSTDDWWSIMERFYSLLCDGVHRFEGRADRFTGDGIMAVFGAPIAQEDHARRGCHAALWLRDELSTYAVEIARERGLEFSVRMGLHSGEVVVGTIGDGVTMEYTAIGRAAGLAQRMESIADAGRIFMTRATARLVEGFFDVSDRGRFDVKGERDPVHVFELVGQGALRTSLEVAQARGLSRFVGRDSEFATLARALADATEGRGRGAVRGG